MRTFSLLFAFIALVLLIQFLLYMLRGPVDPFIATAIFVSFLICLAPALYLLKPFERPGQRRGQKEQREAPPGSPSEGENSRD